MSIKYYPFPQTTRQLHIICCGIASCQTHIYGDNNLPFCQYLVIVLEREKVVTNTYPYATMCLQQFLLALPLIILLDVFNLHFMSNLGPTSGNFLKLSLLSVMMTLHWTNIFSISSIHNVVTNEIKEGMSQEILYADDSLDSRDHGRTERKIS